MSKKTLQNCNRSIGWSVSDTKALAQKFAPIVYIHSKDDSRPSSVDWYLKRVRLCFRNDDNVVLKEGEITFNNLVEQNREGISSAAREFDSDEFIWYLRITDSKVRQGEEIKDGKVQASCYVHVRRAKNSEDIDIQYWFFYPYNGDTATIGSSGTHDADWEHITVRLDSSGNNIKSVCYTGHGENKWCNNDECLANIVWYSANKYDTGDNPSITALPGNKIIEVHNGGGNNNLYYQIGQLHGNSISWNSKGLKYDTGNHPAIAVAADGRIVEVHNGGGNNNLYYRIGRLNNNEIYWDDTESTKYDTGDHPAIVITSDGKVIEVHNGGGNNNLYYRIGHLQKNTIVWDGDSINYDTGNRPAITVTTDGKILEVHNGGENNKLYYRIGQLHTNSIMWGSGSKGIEYDTGDNPSIAVTQSGRIIEVHNGSGDNNNLYYRTGVINDDIIIWDKVKGTKYDVGDRPSLTPTTEGTIIEVHNGGDEKTSMEPTWDARIVEVDSSGNNNLYSNLGLLRNTAFPVVYSAKHSHASYWGMGDHVRLYGLAQDKTDKGPLWEVAEHLVLLHDNPSEDTDNAWNRFSGHWGDSEGKAEIETPSPETIGFKGSWCNDKD